MTKELLGWLDHSEKVARQQGNNDWLQAIGRVRRTVQKALDRGQLPKEFPHLRSEFTLPKSKLDEELARRLNRAGWEALGDHVTYEEATSPYPHPKIPESFHEKWQGLRNQLDSTQRVQIDNLRYPADHLTVGQIRDARVTELMQVDGIGHKRAVFLKTMVGSDRSKNRPENDHLQLPHNRKAVPDLIRRY